MAHAQFEVQTFNLVAITDIGAHAQAMTVTNDIEHVLAKLVDGGALIPGRKMQRVIYRDSDGEWDEVVIDDACCFVCFQPIMIGTGAGSVPLRPKGEPEPGMIFGAMLLTHHAAITLRTSAHGSKNEHDA